MAYLFPPHVPVGMRLVQFRRRFGLSQKAFAEHIGVACSTIEDLERGETRKPNTHTLQKIAQAFDMTIVEVKHVLGLVSLVSPLDITLPVDAVPIASVANAASACLSVRAQRVGVLFDLLPAHLQDVIEGYALVLHGQQAANEIVHAMPPEKPAGKAKGNVL